MGWFRMSHNPRTALALILLVAGLTVAPCYGGITSSFIRKDEMSPDMPMNSDVFRVPPGYNAPQQVHITQGDIVGTAMIVSWITDDEPGSSQVLYGTSEDELNLSADGNVSRYSFYNYTSGYIHHCTLEGLEFSTTYFYEVGIGKTTRKFSFTTPPEVGPDVPYSFGLMGDLGQTLHSNNTLSHYESNPNAKMMLYVGDLSYADDYPDHDNIRWDTWCRFIERSAAYQPWIWTAGDHEIDFAPEIGEVMPFKPYNYRFSVPYEASGSTSPLWYSIKRASAYIIVLSSYSAYGKYTPQYMWLQAELPKVNRSETPWLIVMVHAAWYNSYINHYMEGETMRVMYESWFVQYKVDVVFAGHVHAYERSERISNIAYNITNGDCIPVEDQSAPVYITIGDGGNREGQSKKMTEPQPGYAAFRESSFGHGIFDVKNRTHARFSWHRNHDVEAVVSDSVWLYNRYWNPVDESTAPPP